VRPVTGSGASTVAAFTEVSRLNRTITYQQVLVANSLCLACMMIRTVPLKYAIDDSCRDIFI